MATVQNSVMPEKLKTMDGSEAMRLGPEEAARRARLMSVPTASPLQVVGGSAELPARFEEKGVSGYERRSKPRKGGAAA